MITCYLRYVIDPFKLKEFETYGKMWIPLVEKFGGKHHGYFCLTKDRTTLRLLCFRFHPLPLTKLTEPPLLMTPSVKQLCATTKKLGVF